MKLLVVTGGFPVLSETFIVHKVIGLARRGIDVSVMASGRGDDSLASSLLTLRLPNLQVYYAPPRDTEGLALARLPVMAARAVRRSPSDFRRLLTLLRRQGLPPDRLAKRLYRLLPFVGQRPDLIHFEFASKATELPELFDLFHCPKVVSCRGYDVSIRPLCDPQIARDLKCVFERADAVHCVSRDISEQACRYGLDAAKVLINRPSIDADYFIRRRVSMTRNDPPVIISVGRLHWKKGYEYAIQAVLRLVDAGIPVRYLIAGSGPAEDAVRFAIWELGVGSHVELLGSRSREQVRSLLEGSDLFLLPSVSEGLSNAALEAMAMGIPVVTTTAGGMAEAVRDGVDGFVVPTRDPGALADRIGRLIRDPALISACGQRARTRIESDFTIERQIDQFIAWYEGLLASRRAAPHSSGIP